MQIGFGFNLDFASEYAIFRCTMTREQKFQAIIERLKEKGVDFDPTHISVMVIIGYLDDLAAKGLIESAFEFSDSGRSVRAICEEFDWKPDDNEIRSFVMEMVEQPDRVAFAYMIQRYRDDRENFLSEFEKFKKTQEG